jgi:hypothetical protein
MRTTRLVFNDLQNEFDVIARENLRSIKGGVASSGDNPWNEFFTNQLGVPAISGQDSEGNLKVSIDGGATWMSVVFQLESVSVTGIGSFNRPSMFNSSYDGFGISWADPYGNSYGSSGGNGNASSGYAGGTMLVSGQAGATAFDIFSLMNGALGISATAAATSASIAKLESQMAFATTSKIFGVLDIVSNVYEIAYSEEDMNHKLEDGAQALIGIALIFTGPVGAIVGGVALGAWEIYEYYRDHQPVNAE